MKTITTSRKARNIATKTVQCIPLLLNNSAMKKQLATLFFCLLIGIQAKSINVQIAKVDDACAEGIGSISAFVSGGIAPYTFVWSNGTTNISNDTEDTLHNLFSGSYSLTVYDSNGDSAIGNATLINYATLGRNGLLTGTFITSHGPPPSGVSGYACPNKNDGIVYGLLNIIGGSAPFTISNFSVTNLATGLNSTSAFAYTATGSLGEYFAIDSLMYADQFQLTITDSAGCPGYFSDYEIGPHYYSQVVVNTTPSTNGQNNGSINLSNYLYYWPSGFYISISDGAGFQYINPTAFGSENISNALSAGTYTVYMRFNDTRNNCDTLYNITVSNTNEYYWVGGNGDWNDLNHWSNVSGGAPFYSVPPTAADDVFFDTNSPLGGSCVVRFASIFIAECRNISVVGFPVFSDFNSPTDFNISGSADFGGALFQFASVIHFMANTSVNLIFPPDLNETRIELNSANGSGAFNLAGNLKATIVTLLSGTFNTNGYTVEVENFSTSFTALPRAINLSNSQIFIDDIPGVGTNNFAWNSDSNVVVNAQNASFTSSTPFSGLAIRNTAIKSLTFNNSSGFAFRNVHITSLHNTQSGSFNLHVTGSGYLSIDTIISTATGINNNSAIIGGFDSLVIKVLTDNSLPPLKLNVGSGYCSINKITATNQLQIFSNDTARISIGDVLASSLYLFQQGSLQNPNSIIINNLDCSLSQGINNYNGSYFSKSCTLGTFKIPSGDALHLDSATNINIDTLIATGTAANPILLWGNFSGTQSNIHLNKAFCGDYLNIQGINNTNAPFYAGVNSVDNGNNNNVQFTVCGGIPAPGYYWVGGTGNWNDYANHWATTSGGNVYHTQEPTTNDNVYFDNNSFPTSGDTVDISSPTLTNFFCKDFNCSSVTNNPVFNIPFYLTVSGSFILSPNLAINSYRIVLNPFGTISLQSAGHVLNEILISQGIVNVDDDLEATNVTISGGTISTNGHTINLGTTGNFTLNNWNSIGNFDLSNSSIDCGIFNFQNIGGTNNYSVIANNTTVSCSQLFACGGVSNNFKKINSPTTVCASCNIKEVNTASFGTGFGNNQNYSSHIDNLNLVENSTIVNSPIISGTCNIGKLTISNSECQVSGVTVSTDSLIFDNSQGILLQASDTFYINNSIGIKRTLPIYVNIKSNSASTQCFLKSSSAASICLDSVVVENVTAFGGATFYGGNHSIDLGGNSGWSFTNCSGGLAYYWVGGTGNWNDVTHWATTSGGSTFYTVPPDSSDDVYFDANSFLTATDTIYATISIANVRCHNFDWSGSTGSPTFYRPQNDLNIYGSMNLNPTMNLYTISIYFLSHNTGNSINANGVIFRPVSSQSMYLIFDSQDGEWILNSDIVCDTNSIFTTSVRPKSGVFNTNGYTVVCNDFDIFTQSTVTVLLGSSSIYATDNFTAWNTPPDLTFDAGTSRIYVGDSHNAQGQLLANDLKFNYVECGSMIGSDDTIAHVVTELFNMTAFVVGTLESAAVSTGLIANIYNGSRPSTIRKWIINPNELVWVSGNKFFVDTLFIADGVDTLSISGNDTIVVNSKFIVGTQSTSKTYIKRHGASPFSFFDFGTNDVCVDNLVLQENFAIGTGIHNAGGNSIDGGGNSGWTFTNCSVISDVWPGDANYDLTVNNFDVLNIGLAYNETGPVRVGATNNYVAQPAADWAGFFQTAVNKKHADCNGDGVVDDNDTTAIYLNYGQNHPARLSNPVSPLTTAPLLYIQLTPDTASLSDTLEADIFLGTNTIPVDSIYGIAFTIGFDTAYIDTTYMTFDYTGVWMGTPGVDLLTFQKTRFIDGAVDMAIVRTDHTNIAGFGFLERIGIVVVDNIGARISTPISLSNVRAITEAEYLLTINTNGDSLSLDTTSSVGVNEIEHLEKMISIYPNPAKENFSIHSGQLKMSAVEIYNSLGEKIISEKINANTVYINTNNFSQGIYLVRCITDKGIINKRITIIKP